MSSTSEVLASGRSGALGEESFTFHTEAMKWVLSFCSIVADAEGVNAIKIILLGDSAVGKTKLIERFLVRCPRTKRMMRAARVVYFTIGASHCESNLYP